MRLLPASQESSLKAAQASQKGDVDGKVRHASSSSSQQKELCRLGLAAPERCLFAADPYSLNCLAPWVWNVFVQKKSAQRKPRLQPISSSDNEEVIVQVSTRPCVCSWWETGRAKRSPLPVAQHPPSSPRGCSCHCRTRIARRSAPSTL